MIGRALDWLFVHPDERGTRDERRERLLREINDQQIEDSQQGNDKTKDRR